MLIKYKLFKDCVAQRLRQTSDGIWNCLKSVFKAVGRLIFSLFIMNQYCMPKMFQYEKCVFKASGRLLFSLFIINQYCTSKMFYYKKCVFKAGGRLLFNLFIMNQFSTKNVCSKQVGGCLVYSFLISNVCLKCFTTNFIKTSMNRCFLNCCFLVYSSNFIKLL